MNFFDLIRKRRSIRKYQPRSVEPEKATLIIEAALRAPSSRGFNPWEFIVVDDRDLIDQLSRAKVHGSSFLAGAPMAVVVCANPGISDVWIEDASIAAVFIFLAAESLGLGHCWIQIRERMHSADITSENYVRDVLKIPQTVKVESIVAIGYPDEQQAARSKDNLQYKKIFMNRYGQQ